MSDIGGIRSSSMAYTEETMTWISYRYEYPGLSRLVTKCPNGMTQKWGRGSPEVVMVRSALCCGCFYFEKHHERLQRILCSYGEKDGKKNLSGV